MSEDAFATKYFLDDSPTDGSAKLPATARDVIVTKVRLIGSVAYLIGRDQVGAARPLPKDLFYAWLEITDVVRGNAAVGTRHDVYFGVPGTQEKYQYPHTPTMRRKEYFVVSYIGDDARRRLVGFPVSRREYERWENEVGEYERARGRAGAADQ